MFKVANLKFLKIIIAVMLLLTVLLCSCSSESEIISENAYLSKVSLHGTYVSSESIGSDFDYAYCYNEKGVLYEMYENGVKTTDTEYDENGNVTKVTEYALFLMESNSDISDKKQIRSITEYSADGKKTSYSYFNDNGDYKSFEEYDELGRLARKTVSEFDAEYTIEFEYSLENGMYVAEESETGNYWEPDKTNDFKYIFSQDGKLFHSSENEHNATGKSLDEYEYDEQGNLIREYRAGFCGYYTEYEKTMKYDERRIMTSYKMVTDEPDYYETSKFFDNGDGTYTLKIYNAQGEEIRYIEYTTRNDYLVLEKEYTYVKNEPFLNRTTEYEWTKK